MASPLALLLIILALIATASLATPKGPHQTLLRTSIILTLVACYLMWFVAYMAQLHPLIAPRMSLKSD